MKQSTANKRKADDHIADELIEAIELGIDSDEYCASRAAGATHAEVLQAATNRWGLDAYARFRAKGCSHPEYLTISQLDTEPEWVLNAVVAGAAWDECLGVMRVDALNMHWYSKGLVAGVAHAEFCEMMDRGWFASTYAVLRQMSATHAECLAIPVYSQDWYMMARNAGATHGEYVYAISCYCDIRTYAFLRVGKFEHHQAITLCKYFSRAAAHLVALNSPGERRRLGIAS